MTEGKAKLDQIDHICITDHWPGTRSGPVPDPWSSDQIAILIYMMHEAWTGQLYLQNRVGREDEWE